jgi:hypothetical protein
MSGLVLVPVWVSGGRLVTGNVVPSPTLTRPARAPAPVGPDRARLIIPCFGACAADVHRNRAAALSDRLIGFVTCTFGA